MPKDVLIVEDDEQNGQSLVVMLSEHGHRAALVRDAGAARQFLDGASPCLILVGGLPHEKMRALLRLLRDHHRTIPTVILSTTYQQTYEGDVPVIARPGDSDTLLRVVNRFCAPAPGARAVVN